MGSNKKPTHPQKRLKNTQSNSHEGLSPYTKSPSPWNQITRKNDFQPWGREGLSPQNRMVSFLPYSPKKAKGKVI